MINKGFKIAICEQLEDPKFAKGIVKRGVVRIITAGTLLESNFLNQNSNNYMCALFKESDDKWGFAYTDISTGEFKASTLKYETVLTFCSELNIPSTESPASSTKSPPLDQKTEHNSK